MKKADTLFSQYVRVKVGHCERCGKKDNLQVAHIITRDCKKLRYDEDNVFCLCAGCHLFWAHKKPLEFAEFVREKKGAALYKYLLKTSQVLKPIAITFYEKTIKDLYRKIASRLKT